MYYRDFIVRRFRENPARKITFTEVRRSLVGDVGSVRRVFDFLETWGLINYTGSEKQGAKAGVEDKEKRGTDEGTANGLGVVKSFCTTCKSECNIVCFATEKVSSLIFGFWSHFLRNFHEYDPHYSRVLFPLVRCQILSSVRDALSAEASGEDWHTRTSSGSTSAVAPRRRRETGLTRTSFISWKRCYCTGMTGRRWLSMWAVGRVRGIVSWGSSGCRLRSNSWLNMWVVRHMLSIIKEMIMVTPELEVGMLCSHLPWSGCVSHH